MGQSSVRFFAVPSGPLPPWVADSLFPLVAGPSALAERAHLAVESATGKGRCRAVLARGCGVRGGAKAAAGVGLGGADDVMPFVG